MLGLKQCVVFLTAFCLKTTFGAPAAQSNNDSDAVADDSADPVLTYWNKIVAAQKITFKTEQDRKNIEIFYKGYANNYNPKNKIYFTKPKNNELSSSDPPLMGTCSAGFEPVPDNFGCQRMGATDQEFCDLDEVKNVCEAQNKVCNPAVKNKDEDICKEKLEVQDSNNDENQDNNSQPPKNKSEQEKASNPKIDTAGSKSTGTSSDSKNSSAKSKNDKAKKEKGAKNNSETQKMTVTLVFVMTALVATFF